MCDPACGTCGCWLQINEYLRENHPEILRDEKLRKNFHHGLFHGFDFDNTMLRIGSMNMLLHGVENPDIRYRDSLSQDHAGEEEKYTLVLANPPFAGSLDYENCAKDLQQIVKTKKTERFSSPYSSACSSPEVEPLSSYQKECFSAHQRHTKNYGES